MDIESSDQELSWWFSDDEDEEEVLKNSFRVRVHVVCARNLIGTDKSKADIYLKAVCKDQVRWAKQQKGGLNPYWGQWLDLTLPGKPDSVTIHCWNDHHCGSDGNVATGHIICDLGKLWDAPTKTGWYKLAGVAHGALKIGLRCTSAGVRDKYSTMPVTVPKPLAETQRSASAPKLEAKKNDSEKETRQNVLRSGKALTASESLQNLPVLRLRRMLANVDDVESDSQIPAVLQTLDISVANSAAVNDLQDSPLRSQAQAQQKFEMKLEDEESLEVSFGGEDSVDKEEEEDDDDGDDDDDDDDDDEDEDDDRLLVRTFGHELASRLCAKEGTGSPGHLAPPSEHPTKEQALDMGTHAWQIRQRALQEADGQLACALAFGDTIIGRASAFDSGVRILCKAAKDRVGQVFIAALPLLQTVFQVESNDAQSTGTLPASYSPSLLRRLVHTLISRASEGGGGHECGGGLRSKCAAEAYKAVLFLLYQAKVPVNFVSAELVPPQEQTSSSSGGGAINGGREGAARRRATAAGAAGLGNVLVRLQLLQSIVHDFGLSEYAEEYAEGEFSLPRDAMPRGDDGSKVSGSGLTIGCMMSVVLPVLEHSSSRVREAAAAALVAAIVSATVSTQQRTQRRQYKPRPGLTKEELALEAELEVELEAERAVEEARTWVGATTRAARRLVDERLLGLKPALLRKLLKCLDAALAGAKRKKFKVLHGGPPLPASASLQSLEDIYFPPHLDEYRPLTAGGTARPNSSCGSYAMAMGRSQLASRGNTAAGGNSRGMLASRSGRAALRSSHGVRPSTGSMRQGTGGGRGANDASDDAPPSGLAYAAPLNMETKQEMAPVLALFGEQVVRAACSNDWELRAQALELVAEQVMSQGMIDVKVLCGVRPLLLRVLATGRTTNYSHSAVLDPALQLLKVVAAAPLTLPEPARSGDGPNRLAVNGPKAMEVKRKVFSVPLALLMAKLSDRRARVREQLVEALVELARRSVLGLGYVMAMAMREEHEDEMKVNAAGTHERQSKEDLAKLGLKPRGIATRADLSGRMLLVKELGRRYGVSENGGLRQQSQTDAELQLHASGPLGAPRSTSSGELLDVPLDRTLRWLRKWVAGRPGDTGDVAAHSLASDWQVAKTAAETAAALCHSFDNSRQNRRGRHDQWPGEAQDSADSERLRKAVGMTTEQWQCVKRGKEAVVNVLTFGDNNQQWLAGKPIENDGMEDEAAEEERERKSLQQQQQMTMSMFWVAHSDSIIQAFGADVVAKLTANIDTTTMPREKGVAQGGSTRGSRGSARGRKEAIEWLREEVGTGLVRRLARHCTSAVAGADGREELDEGKTWELVTGLLRFVVADPAPIVALQALKLTQSCLCMHETKGEACSQAGGMLRWDSLEGQLAIGPLLKALVERLGDPNVRLRQQTLATLRALAAQHVSVLRSVSREAGRKPRFLALAGKAKLGKGSAEGGAVAPAKEEARHLLNVGGRLKLLCLLLNEKGGTSMDVDVDADKDSTRRMKALGVGTFLRPAVDALQTAAEQIQATTAESGMRRRRTPAGGLGSSLAKRLIQSTVQLAHAASAGEEGRGAVESDNGIGIPDGVRRRTEVDDFVETLPEKMQLKLKAIIVKMGGVHELAAAAAAATAAATAAGEARARYRGGEGAGGDHIHRSTASTATNATYATNQVSDDDDDLYDFSSGGGGTMVRGARGLLSLRNSKDLDGGGMAGTARIAGSGRGEPIVPSLSFEGNEQNMNQNMAAGNGTHARGRAASKAGSASKQMPPRSRRPRAAEEGR
jgi:hypothetical protein